ncbi:hypothetical protein GTV32_15040 [Gordonia sp. SID5947]|uniref:hypothetical protein n=1 Tax=Gordonia sp. SID5947 TaxID=2690315 RepID=UPI00136EBFC1|nr:hypothetical protein [Gordonia sp. SID5947]MYR07535.1 hypothetical protein [Gordonia sp. SID5947]
MSGDTTQVEAQQLLAGAGQLDDVANALTTIRDELRGRLEAEGQAWGADKPGTSHASGYEPQTQNIMDATETKVDSMIQYVHGIENAAKNFVGSESDNASRYGR